MATWATNPYVAVVVWSRLVFVHRCHLDYGAANKFGFDDPNKWVTVPSVPLLDEHEMSNEQGKPIAQVDRSALEEIARNNNKRVMETGDPATLILGHTSDDPRAEEKPAKGFVVNYQVKPFKRDPVTGRVIFAIHGDYKVRPQNKHLLEEYPRRSVELWWNKKELDPIAMLGGSSPERDLGVVIRHGRINHVSLDHTTKHGASNVNSADTGEVRKYRRNGRDYTVISYGIETPIRRSRATQGATGMNGNGRGGYPSRNGRGTPNRRYGADCGPDGMPNRYEDGDMDTDDLHDAGDEGVPNEDEGDGMDSAESDPVLAKLFQSKQWKDLTSQMSEIMQAITGGGAGDQPGGDPGAGPDGIPGTPDDGMGGELPPPGGGGAPGMGNAPPPGPGGGGDGMEPEEDERRMHGQAPVQMSAGMDSGFAGPGSTYIPNTKGHRNKPYQRGTTTVNRNTTPATRLEREVADLKQRERTWRLKYAKSEAAAIVAGLEAEGVLFGQTPEAHDKGKADDTAYITALLADGDDKEVDFQVNNVIRARYARKRPDPATPSAPGLARFSRPVQGTDGPAGRGGDDEDNFEDSLTDDRQACEFADLQTVRKMSRTDAIKFMKKKHGIR